MMPSTSRNSLPQDLPFIRGIVEMFLTNQMTEAERACEVHDGIDGRPRLYIRAATSLMRSMRALMSFENDDLVKAQDMLQDTMDQANRTRLTVSWTSRLTSFPFDAALSNARRMTAEQLHAELVYAECLCGKAIMGLVSSEDWVSFLREVLNIRSVVAIYRTLNAFLEEYDEEVKAGSALTSQAKRVDDDFRSGVYLGMGMCLLVFSVIPSQIFGFSQFLIGFKGDTFEGLRLLRKAGGWGTDQGLDHTQRAPRISKERGGARRPLCDLILVIFHLVASDITREGVDVREAENIMEWNLRQYSDSVFFLFGKGRLHVARSRPDLAIEIYKDAKAKIADQRGYEQLGSVMLWEMALCYMALGQWRESAACWGKLKETAKWSKVVYAYGRAACLLQAGNLSQEETIEVDELMKQVPTLLQRIAGKSIPLEKFVARKARRYLEEGRLVAPALELAYMLQATNRATDEALENHARSLKDSKSSVCEDDRQIVNLLLAATYRHLDFPNSEDIIAPSEIQAGLGNAELVSKAHVEETRDLLIEAKESGPILRQEYWVAYFAHYELGRLYEELGCYSEAHQCFATVASECPLESPTNARTGKYSLQNTIVLRARASIAVLPPTPQNARHPRPRPGASNSVPGSFSTDGGYENSKWDADRLEDEQEAEMEPTQERGRKEARTEREEEEHVKRGVYGAMLKEEAREQEVKEKEIKGKEEVEQEARRAEEDWSREREERKQSEIESKASPLNLDTSNNPSLVPQPFYPVDSDGPRHPLSFARFDSDPELLSSIQDLNVPVLQNTVWRPNSDGELYGGFSCVKRASWNDQDIAVKFLRGDQTVTGEARSKRSFRRELIAWMELDHPNILPFLGVVCAENKYLGMVSPYMPNGSAPKYIAKHPEANLLQILYDVAAGMSYLAAQRPPIAHGDLKGQNVLIDQDGRARICDFGLSQLMASFKSIDTRCGGTIRWMAPEQLVSPTMLVSLPADIFSWGMLALELMTGSIPWAEIQQDGAVVIKVGTRHERPNRPTCKTQRCQKRPKCACLIGDDVLWGLIQRCWLREPTERPTAAQLCEVLAQDNTTKPRGNGAEIQTPKPLILSDPSVTSTH